MRKTKIGFGSLVVLWPIAQYFLDWYREPGPMLNWGFLERLISGGWLLVVGIFGLWLVYDALRRLSK